MKPATATSTTIVSTTLKAPPLLTSRVARQYPLSDQSRFRLVCAIRREAGLPPPDQAVHDPGDDAGDDSEPEDPGSLGPVVGRDDRRPAGHEDRDRNDEPEEDAASVLQVPLLLERIGPL